MFRIPIQVTFLILPAIGAGYRNLTGLADFNPYGDLCIIRRTFSLMILMIVCFYFALKFSVPFFFNILNINFYLFLLAIFSLFMEIIVGKIVCIYELILLKEPSCSYGQRNLSLTVLFESNRIGTGLIQLLLWLEAQNNFLFLFIYSSRAFDIYHIWTCAYIKNMSWSHTF